MRVVSCYQCCHSFCRQSYTEQKDRDVEEAARLGYKWIRSPGLSYGYVVESLKSTVSLLTMGAIRSKPQVAAMVRDGDVVYVLLLMLCTMLLQLLCFRLRDVGDVATINATLLIVAIVCSLGGR